MFLQVQYEPEILTWNPFGLQCRGTDPKSSPYSSRLWAHASTSSAILLINTPWSMLSPQLVTGTSHPYAHPQISPCSVLFLKHRALTCRLWMPNGASIVNTCCTNGVWPVHRQDGSTALWSLLEMQTLQPQADLLNDNPHIWEDPWVIRMHITVWEQLLQSLTLKSRSILRNTGPTVESRCE